MDEQLRLGDSDALITLKQAWEKSLKLLAPEINRPSFESFFKTATPLSYDNGVVTLSTASELGRIFLGKYTDLLKAALDANLGTEVEIVLVVSAPEKPEVQAPSRAARPPDGGLTQLSLPLNEKYLFSNFVVGPCNRLAHAASLAVAKKPGRTYNPLFLYGGSGLGKTHLLQAIGNHVLANHPRLRVAYVSGETFTFHFVSALREHRSEDFRRKCRSVDLWLVDDVQFLVGKERTKEEFFHTFNALHQTNKQIVLSSDRAPKNLSPIEDRLTSRFQSGLVADVSPPDYETRIAILQDKAAADAADIPDEVLMHVASLIQTNVRALEGALVTLLAYASLMKVRLTPRLAEEIVTRYLIDKKSMELTLEAIQRAVAEAFGVQTDDLRSPKRQRELVTARHVAMYLCRELTAYSLPAIGKAFGGRDHATVAHACTHVKKLLADDEALKQTVERLSDDLRSGRY